MRTFHRINQGNAVELGVMEGFDGILKRISWNFVSVVTIHGRLLGVLERPSWNFCRA